MEIVVNNVNHALREGLHYLLRNGIEESSRNGPVLVSPDPVMTVYERPWERVLFSPMRDANPFFHLFEALWMLAGRNDIEFPMYFNKRFADYSDDGFTAHGAYGERWRSNLGFNQLPVIIEELKKNPQTRRCVLQMWDGREDPCCIDKHGKDDLHKAMTGCKDVPCNTHVYFDVRGHRLNMTVLCRSNDIFWGAYGANAVHFSFLQEYVATKAGYAIGRYRQFSNNYHLYTELYPGFEKRDKFYQLINDTMDLYRAYNFHRVPLISNEECFDEELNYFMTNRLEGRAHHYLNDFFPLVAIPMLQAWVARKEMIDDLRPRAIIDEKVKAEDWRRACLDWIDRRANRARTKTA